MWRKRRFTNILRISELAEKVRLEEWFRGACESDLDSSQVLQGRLDAGHGPLVNPTISIEPKSRTVMQRCPDAALE